MKFLYLQRSNVLYHLHLQLILELNWITTQFSINRRPLTKFVEINTFEGNFLLFLSFQPLTTEESESTSDSFEKNVKTSVQSKPKFWWMKQKPVPDSLTLAKPSVQLKIPSVADISHPDFLTERSRDDSNFESSRDSADIDNDLTGVKMKEIATRAQNNAPSPDFSSSTAEFLAKELICRVSTLINP